MIPQAVKEAYRPPSIQKRQSQLRCSPLLSICRNSAKYVYTTGMDPPILWEIMRALMEIHTVKCAWSCFKMQRLTRFLNRVWRRWRSRNPERSRTGRRRCCWWPERRVNTAVVPVYQPDRPTPQRQPSCPRTRLNLNHDITTQRRPVSQSLSLYNWKSCTFLLWTNVFKKIYFGVSCLCLCTTSRKLNLGVHAPTKAYKINRIVYHDKDKIIR